MVLFLEQCLLVQKVVGLISLYFWIGSSFFIAIILPARPVLIIEDGDSSHVSLEVIKLARENDIYLLCFPSHCTHIL